MKWNRIKFDSLDGLPKYRYTLETGQDKDALPDFYIEASRKGVVLKGELCLPNHESLQPFAKAIGDAYKDHRKLMPNLGLNLAGH